MLTKAEIARIRSFKEKKHRECAGLFVVEGEKVVKDLLAAKFPLSEIYATADWVSPQGAVPSRIVSEMEMKRISHFPTPSSVLAVGKIARTALEEGELNHGFTLALDGIQDAGNVGTLLRVADWFAFDRVLLSPECADLFSQKVINASMGSFARVRTVAIGLSEALVGLSVPILGCSLEGQDIVLLRAIRDAVVVVGSEGHGLSTETLKYITEQVTIPGFGGAESLNAAVAAGIVCHHLRSQSP